MNKKSRPYLLEASFLLLEVDICLMPEERYTITAL